LTDHGYVRVRGAREHNLRDVDVDIPRDALVAFTGISGSGKSSLAFGTIYAEAQRRYFESVAPYARRLIHQAGVPDVDSIEGLPPAIALQQQRGTPSSRSSVGSATTISNLLRMLFSRAGSYPSKQPMLFAEDFSPNTPQGACPVCHGQGRIYDATEASMVPDDGLTIRERAVAAWPTAWHGQNLRDILTTLGHDVDTPWRELPKKTRDWILFTDEQPTVPVYAGFTRAEVRSAIRQKMEPSYQGTFTSARRYVLDTYATTQSESMRRRAARHIVGTACPSCAGKRLKKEALSVTFGGHDIAELTQMPMSALAEVLRPAAEGRLHPDDRTTAYRKPDRSAAANAAARRLAAGGSAHAAAPDVRRTANLSEEKLRAAQRLSQDIVARIATLAGLGLGYLPLSRTTPTLSAGELQRLRLATQLASQLFGVIYVLDEPSAGLHPADSVALLTALERLKAAGNSLFVVEHDLDLIRRADWIVDVGPQAGQHGGRILYSGPPEGLHATADSLTARYLLGAPAMDALKKRRVPGRWLRLAGVERNNLRGIDVAFPIGCLTAVTGVSGSGKSSLVSQALHHLVAAHLGHESAAPEPETPFADDVMEATRGRITEGADAIGRLVCVDQKPIGRTPRSNLATYTGLFDAVRQRFAATPDARRRRYDAGRFSFNVAKGRCPTCDGEGFVSVELLFMPDVYAPCPACHGSRYNPQTLEVRYRDRSIADVLALTVEEAGRFFADEPQVRRALDALQAVGLGYLRLGQPATELSGGEAQRIKLATELQRLQHGRTLYVLDEPTTGLHAADVHKLMTQLDGLVEAGNTVVVIEHDMSVVACCDWVIDMGPGAGGDGGQVVDAATPEEIAARAVGATAPYLARALGAA
jgi:excinuclease ABC subunit A